MDVREKSVGTHGEDSDYLIAAICNDPEDKPCAFFLAREYSGYGDEDFGNDIDFFQGNEYTIRVRLISESEGKLYDTAELGLSITEEPTFYVKLYPRKNPSSRSLV